MVGIEAINYWLDEYPQKIQSRFTKDFILEGIELILKKMICLTFDGSFNWQLNCNSPTYATLSIAYLEVKLYERINTEYGEEFTHYFTEYWKHIRRLLYSIDKT